MRKIASKLVLLGMCAILGLSAVTPLTVRAQGTVSTEYGIQNPTSGQCGKNAYWSYDTTSKTLNITGSGDMYDYEGWGSNMAPWTKNINSYYTEIKNLNISKDITRIGNYAFENLQCITTLTLPKNLKSIGKQALSYTLGLKKITIPDKVKVIEDGAFQRSGFSEIIIGKNVTKIESHAFFYPMIRKGTGVGSLKGIKTVKLTIKSEKLKSVGTFAFYNPAGTLKIATPSSKASAYKKMFTKVRDKGYKDLKKENSWKNASKKEVYMNIKFSTF